MVGSAFVCLSVRWGLDVAGGGGGAVGSMRCLFAMVGWSWVDIGMGLMGWSVWEMLVVGVDYKAHSLRLLSEISLNGELGFELVDDERLVEEEEEAGESSSSLSLSLPFSRSFPWSCVGRPEEEEKCLWPEHVANTLPVG